MLRGLIREEYFGGNVCAARMKKSPCWEVHSPNKTPNAGTLSRLYSLPFSHTHTFIPPHLRSCYLLWYSCVHGCTHAWQEHRSIDTVYVCRRRWCVRSRQQFELLILWHVSTRFTFAVSLIMLSSPFPLTQLFLCTLFSAKLISRTYCKMFGMLAEHLNWLALYTVVQILVVLYFIFPNF